MTLVAAGELGRYGVKVNCLAPIARTRMTLATPGLEDVVKAPEDGSFDKWDPANVSPLVAYLSTADCPFTGGVFHVGGNEVGLYGGWSLAERRHHRHRRSLDRGRPAGPGPQVGRRSRRPGLGDDRSSAIPSSCSASGSPTG